jgi:(p)ppGpp synthase/HD superfamily hydrolase
MRKKTGTPDPIYAAEYAELAHSGQQYNDELPYTSHLRSVVAVLARFGETSPTMVCAAWLHDSIEDTKTSYNDIKERFGVEVAELVYAVTSELGRNRKERNAKTYPKLREAGEKAMMLKLADRIANVEYGMATGGKNDMYAKEFPDFETELRYVHKWEHCCKRDDCGDGHYVSVTRLPSLEPLWNYLSTLLKDPK